MERSGNSLAKGVEAMERTTGRSQVGSPVFSPQMSIREQDAYSREAQALALYLKQKGLPAEALHS